MTHHKSVIGSGQSNLMHVDGMLSQSADPYESVQAFVILFWAKVVGSGTALVWDWVGQVEFGCNRI